jgi:lipopolysaccharide export system permease protein
MKIINRFLISRFFGGLATVLLVVCGVVFAITFVERMPSNDTAIGAIVDAWTRLLEYIPLFLPLAVFMGTLFASYKLTKSSESIIISGAGLSPYQAARPFLIGAFLIGLITTTVINPYSVGLSAQNITAEKLNLVDDAIWLRESGDNGTITLRAENVSIKHNKLIFQNATIFTQTPDSKLANRIETREITLSDNGLDSPQANIWNKNGQQHTDKFHADTLLNPQTVLDRYMQPNHISFWQLPGFIHKMEKIGAPVRRHLVQFWTLLFLPITMIAMAILGVAFSQTHQRRNYSFATKFSLGIITCFALYFLTNVFNALGASNTLPALLAVVAPPLIIIAMAGIFISSFDGV